MKIRRTLALVLAIVMAFSLAACGNAEPAGDDGSEAKTEIVAALNSVPGNLDISATMGVALLSVSPHIYDYLIDMDEDYNFIPAIATSWERVDDTTWTFECDVSGYTFSNGDPLEMDDITYSWTWPFQNATGTATNQGDELDTLLGDNAANGQPATISITVTTTVTQID